MTIAARLPDHRRRVISAIIQLAAGQPDQARANLDALPREQSPVRSLLEFRLLHADLALVQRSHHASLLVREVLDLIERHGFVQTVLDTAPHLTEYLMADWDRYPRSEHLTPLVGAAVESRRPRPIRAGNGKLSDPLTDTEIRVLRRLPQRLSYGDIASDLHLSLNTVKTHLRHAYMKLGVTSRSAAIKRAAALGLL